jgi:hypothetical protein
VGNLRDWWSEMSLERRNWFDSDLCILEPMNSTQLAAFEQLKLTGLLCSRFSATVRKGRRFFTLAGEGAELPNGKGGKKKEAPQQQQRPASPAVPASDGGSHVEGSVADDSLAVPGPSGLNARAVEIPPPVLAVEPATAGEPAGELAVEPARVRPPVSAAEPAAAAEPASELLSVSTVKSAAVAEPAGEASATEPAATVGLASESLSVLAAESVAAEPAAGPSVESAVEPAVESAAEPAVATAAEPAVGPMAAEKGRQCWLIDQWQPQRSVG